MCPSAPTQKIGTVWLVEGNSFGRHHLESGNVRLRVIR
jgi:hypothetical protein